MVHSQCLSPCSFTITLVYSNECTVSQDVASSLLPHFSFNSAVLSEKLPQAELCTRYGFIKSVTCNLVHDTLKMAHMCRNMLGQN